MSAPAAPVERRPAPPPAPEPAPSSHPQPETTVLPPRGGLSAGAAWPAALALAAVLCFVTFYAKGGLELESIALTELALTLAGGAIVAICALAAPAGGRLYGVWPAALLLAFAALSGLSVVWSVQPDHSWQDSGRLLAYAAVFAAGVALARLRPQRWPALLGGVLLAACVVCGYALLTKVFPSIAPTDLYARLEEPYGYWNAIGLTAAMGAICCLWLGARRTGPGLLGALAYPAMGLLLLTLALAYSRGALAALAVGVAVWLCIVPLRLRGAALLIAGGLGAGALAAWAFSTHALSAEGVPLAERASAGHELGALIVAMLAVLGLVGVAAGFLSARRPLAPSGRRNAGAALLAGLVLALLAFAGALAHSQRGFTGSVSHAVDSLTNPNAKTPPNTPDRLTAVASVRARYWKEALQVFAAHPALGAGAEGYQTARLRYRKETLEVRHAHGFVVQTLADLGIVGLLLALATLLSWAAAAGRATHPLNRAWSGWRSWRSPRDAPRPGWRRLEDARERAYTPERIGMLTLLALVVVFGVHSLVDWTWYVPGDACVALLCAGWLAGRGPLRSTAAPATPLRLAWQPRSPRTWVGAAVLALALLAAWSQWQPQRAEEARGQALALLRSDPRAAEAAARSAVSRDPLSVEALFALAQVQESAGRRALARATLQRAVKLQPSNPQTWLALGRYDLAGDPAAAVKELEAAIYLNPEAVSPEAIARGDREAIELHNDYVQALRAAAATPPLRSARARRSPAAPVGRRGGLPRPAPARR